MFALALAALLAQAAPPPAAAPAPPPAPSTWAGTAALGFIWLSGNTDTQTLAGNLSMEHKTPDWIWGFKANGAYGRASLAGSSAQVTALNAGAQLRGDRRFTEALSAYLIAGIDADHLKSIESRPFGEAGLSQMWIDEKEGELQKQTLRTDLGFRYGREYRFNYYPTPSTPSPSEVDVVAPRVGLLYRYALSADVLFSEEASVLTNVSGEFRALSTSATKLSTHLTKAASVGVAFLLNHDSVPPTGKKNLDTALTVSLEVGL